MGAAASSHANADQFTDVQKIAIFKAIKENMEEINSSDSNDLSAFQHLSSAVSEALAQTEANSPDEAGDDNSVEQATAQLAKLTKMTTEQNVLMANLADEAQPVPIAQGRLARMHSEAIIPNDDGGGGGGSPTGDRNNPNFRERRLTLAKKQQDALGAVGDNGDEGTEGEGGRERQVYKSGEIGEGKEAFLPFLNTTLGTYSCHGVEPDWYSADGVAAKINQDRGVIVYPYGGDNRKALFAVFDGHGERGQLVSQFCMTEIQARLEQHASFLTDPPLAMKETFVEVDEAMKDRGDEIEPVYSGTTAVMVLMHEKHLYIANVGDSRATVGRRTAGTLEAKDLSVDQNPNAPVERKRIEDAGGYVSEPPEEGLSARVWLDPAMTQIGLAMSRSLGDHAVKHIGVIARPEVLEHDLIDEDEFMIIASDGVWEFITSDEAVQIIGEYITELGASRACEILINIAAARWQEEEGDYRDDITAVVVKLPCLDSVVPVENNS